MSAEAMKVSSVLDTSHLKVKFPFKAKYGNYINGKFVEPKSGKYFDNVSPISNEKICSVARSNEQDVEAALDAAHAAFPEPHGGTPPHRAYGTLRVMLNQGTAQVP